MTPPDLFPDEQVTDIFGYESLYMITSYGRVWSKPRVDRMGRQAGGLWRAPQMSIHGYPFVTLYKENKSKNHTIHRLVAEAFLPNPQNLPEVNLIDNDRANPHLWNLS